MIEHTKKLVEEKFTVLGGYEHNAEVIICLLENLFCLQGQLQPKITINVMFSAGISH